jgi:hypothetical protein
MTGIFRDLAANRKLDHDTTLTAVNHFVVVSIKKDGTPRKVMANDMQYSARTTLIEAEKHKINMELMNPGKRFAIVTL